MPQPITLYAHHGCPYVQRVAIVLAEKGLAHTRQDIDLHHKPSEFEVASPLGLVPVLRVGDEAIFDSAVICEYLDEMHPPQLHPLNPLRRAQHRAWMAFGTALLQSVGGFFKARDARTQDERRREVLRLLHRLESELPGSPYFAGASFTMVDVVFAPVFRYFDAFALMESYDFFTGLPKLTAWREQLAQRPSVQAAVQPDFLLKLVAYLGRLDSALARSARVGRGAP